MGATDLGLARSVLPPRSMATITRKIPSFILPSARNSIECSIAGTTLPFSQNAGTDLTEPRSVAPRRCRFEPGNDRQDETVSKLEIPGERRAGWCRGASRSAPTVRMSSTSILRQFRMPVPPKQRLLRRFTPRNDRTSKKDKNFGNQYIGASYLRSAVIQGPFQCNGSKIRRAGNYDGCGSGRIVGFITQHQTGCGEDGAQDG